MNIRADVVCPFCGSSQEEPAESYGIRDAQVADGWLYLTDKDGDECWKCCKTFFVKVTGDVYPQDFEVLKAL